MVDPIALAIPVFFAMIGVELLVARAQGLRPYRFADAITCLSCGIGQQVTGVFVKLVVVLPYAWVSAHARLFELGGIAAHVVAFFGVDLAYYLWHRWTHESSLGWATHVVHHQSEDYNLAVALRQSMTSSLSSWPFYLPLAVVGVPAEVFGLHAALNTLYQFWIHTETVDKLGPIEWVMNTPSHHRVHHAVNAGYLDKNYAGVLIVWDRLFGTFAPEVERPVYGTVTPLASFDPLWANVAFVVERLRETARALPADRARAWIAGPGWVPSGVPAHGPAPQTPEAQVKYDPHGAPGTAVYVLAWFVPTAAATTGMLWFAHDAPKGWLAVVMALVLWTTWSWGALFERRPHAVPAELARLAAVVAATVAGTAGTPAWWAGIAAAGGAAVSAAALLRR